MRKRVAPETASGLRFRIGRIEGSIFGETRLKNVAVLDQRGVFVTSPEIEIDWTPPDSAPASTKPPSASALTAA